MGYADLAPEVRHNDKKNAAKSEVKASQRTSRAAALKKEFERLNQEIEHLRNKLAQPEAGTDAKAAPPQTEIKRYPLNMRTTKSLRQRLERAAQKSGRSLAQEVERRLERSLDFDHHLVVTRGDFWSPIFFAKGDIWVTLGDDPRDDPEEHTVVLKISPENLKRFKNYFSGAPFPYDASNEEIEAAGERYLQMLSDIKKGK